MIGNFLSSKFSGYIAIAGVIAILGLVWYIYNEGKTACENSVKSAQLDDTIEVQARTLTIKKDEQGMTASSIDEALCDMGIARERKGCD